MSPVPTRPGRRFVKAAHNTFELVGMTSDVANRQDAWRCTFEPSRFHGNEILASVQAEFRDVPGLNVSPKNGGNVSQA
jgi:hypothetical protein